MNKITGISHYLSEDHRRLEELLRRATIMDDRIEPDAYMAFRGGLLRHIGMEEKVLLPAAQAARGGDPLPVASKLRLDHGALAALLVLTPTVAIVAAIRSILISHHPIEEGSDGIYAQCEHLDGFDNIQILARLKSYPPVATASYVDNPTAIQSARNAIKRAGHDLQF